MRFRPPSVRARLTLWHAGVLTLIVCIFSAGILLFVEARLYAGLDAQLDREIAAIGKIYREEPDELKDLASHWGITLFQVDEAGGIRQQTEAWGREGLSRALQPSDSPSPLSWTAPSGRHYRVHSLSESSYRVAAAVEETALRDTLWTLAVILAMGIPFAAALAIAGGYFLAGRVLSPVGAMAQKAREITAESLAKRLPVDNARDEFGQLATRYLSRRHRQHAGGGRQAHAARREPSDPHARRFGKSPAGPRGSGPRRVGGTCHRSAPCARRRKAARAHAPSSDPSPCYGRRCAHPACAHESDTQCHKIHPKWRHDHRRSECDGRAGHDRGTRHGTGGSCRASGSYFRSLLSRRH